MHILTPPIKKSKFDQTGKRNKKSEVKKFERKEKEEEKNVSIIQIKPEKKEE